MAAGARPYDVVVVGAGPAGAAAGAHLAQGGARVLLLDRAEFPRDKACGGGLTPRGVAALERLGIDPSVPGFVHVGGLSMSAGSRTLATRFPGTSRWPSYGVVARRSFLDQQILDVAAARGVEFRGGVRVHGPVMEGGVCRGVRTRDGEILAPWTIAADGATSVMARGAGSYPNGGGFWYTALRSYFAPVTPLVHDGDPVLEFYPLRTHDGRWLPAYGWVFPLPDGSANVGVDLPHRPALGACRPLHAAYDAFVAQLRLERPGFEAARELASPVGALLPEAMAGWRPGVAGMLGVGDAAGAISPYSGEGIVYALEGAELAAAAILTGGAPATTVAAYSRAMWESYGFQFRWALAFMKAMRRAPLARTAATLGLRSPRVLRAAVRIMAFLIEDDVSAPPSTVSRAYLGFKRAFPPRSRRLWARAGGPLSLRPEGPVPDLLHQRRGTGP